MGFSSRSYAPGYSSQNLFPAGVRWLLIVNVALYIVYFFAVRSGYGPFFNHFALMPAAVVHSFAIWQIFTYMFVHSAGDVQHILFNMLMLWMFGKEVENAWGTRKFLKYYFICGMGAGVCVILANYMFGDPYTRTIGASGAIYGLLLAFGMLFPDSVVLFSFIFPMKAKYMVAIMAGIAFLMSFSANSSVSNVAHLGGMLVGYIYFKMPEPARRPTKFKARGPGFFENLGEQYQAWKLQRARRKFQVYMKKHGGSGNDPTPN